MVLWPSPSVFPAPQTMLANSSSGNTARSKSQNGAYTQRNRFSTQVNTLSISWLMTDAVYSYFINFHNAFLNLGANWFRIEIPLRGTATEVVARFYEGAYTASIEPVGYWRVAAQLELKEKPVMFLEDLNLLLA